MSVRHKIVLFFIIIPISIFASYTHSAENDSVLDNNIEQTLAQFRTEYHLPGVSVSIKTPDSTSIRSYVSGYDSRVAKKAITPETLFQVGSITKTFVASMVFQLIEQQKLTLRDKISTWLPQYPRWRDISVADLLRHTSGVYNYTAAKTLDKLLNDNPKKHWSFRELADMAYQQADGFKPGTQYNYTNTDYILLGMIIEQITQKSMQQVFNDYLQHYHLNHTIYNPFATQEQQPKNLAQGYNEDGTLPQGTNVMAHNLSFLQSAGGLTSTPNDLVYWLEQLFAGSIISASSLAEMTASYSEKDVQLINLIKLKPPRHSGLFTELGSGAGIGLVYFNHNGFTWVHSGGTLGYESLYVYSPCNGIYLALTYNVKPKSQFIFMQIADKLFKLLNHSPEVKKQIKTYQHNTPLPKYCYPLR